MAQPRPCRRHPARRSTAPVPQPGGSRAPARAATTPGKHPRFRSSCLGRAAAERQPVPPPSGPGGSRAPARAATTPGQHPWVSCSPSPVPRSTAALPRAARPAAAHHITAALLQQPVVAATTPQPCRSALVSLVSLLRNHQLESIFGNCHPSPVPPC
jgi:hypothetical protein